MTTRTLTLDETHTLEAMLDRTDLSAIMRTLCRICDEKAVHIEANWQDAELASRWNDASIACANMAERPAITRVSA